MTGLYSRNDSRIQVVFYIPLSSGDAVEITSPSLAFSVFTVSV